MICGIWVTTLGLSRFYTYFSVHFLSVVFIDRLSLHVPIFGNIPKYLKSNNSTTWIVCWVNKQLTVFSLWLRGLVIGPQWGSDSGTDIYTSKSRAFAVLDFIFWHWIYGLCVSGMIGVPVTKKSTNSWMFCKQTARLFFDRAKKLIMVSLIFFFHWVLFHMCKYGKTLLKILLIIGKQ